MYNVQYGCGLSAPSGWLNFDASPTLRMQRLPLIGSIIARGRVRFPKGVTYGDVCSGLPVASNSCDAVYASHVLEHLSLEDFYVALKETLRIMKSGGHFRAIVPDLEIIAKDYLSEISLGHPHASHAFMRESLLGVEQRAKGIRGRLMSSLGNQEHLWMWDALSLQDALREAGFSQVRIAQFGDSQLKAFSLVEEQSRFDRAIAVEAIK